MAFSSAMLGNHKNTYSAIKTKWQSAEWRFCASKMTISRKMIEKLLWHRIAFYRMTISKQHWYESRMKFSNTTNKNDNLQNICGTAECHSAKCLLSEWHYAEYHLAQWNSAQCHLAEWPWAECHLAKGLLAEWYITECHSSEWYSAENIQQNDTWQNDT